MIEITRDLLVEILDHLYELQGEWFWKKGEPRLRYSEQYQRLCKQVDLIEKILSDSPN